MRDDVRAGATEFHWPLLLVAALVSALGIYNLHSSAAARDPTLYINQLYLLLASVVLAGLLLVPDYRVTERVAYFFYGLICLALVAVLVQGYTAGGAQRWLSIGPVRFQPSEPAKLAVVLCLARYFSVRSPRDGFTVRSLVRPLNLSRPLAVFGILIVFWNKPWLADPIGELARLVRKQFPGGPPEVEQLLWLRGSLAVGLALGCAIAVWLILRFEKQNALLNPWPPGRRNRLIAGAFVITMAGAVLLATFWNARFLGDPFGVLINSLWYRAGAGGIFETLRQGLGLRLLFLAAAVAFLLGALWSLRSSKDDRVDLIVAPIDLLVVPAVLVLVEPDLGTAGVILLIGATMILVVGVRARSLVILAVTGLGLAAVGWFGVLKDYQKRRILTFIDPEHDIRGAGWNAVQSMIAVGSGQWFGKGHRGGTQTQLSFLPEQHTDFAFSVWAEEMGFVGCLLLLVLYAVLIGLAFAVAASARERYGALLAVGVAAIILWQALINVSMVVGVFPVVGLTLPLFSYGGTSLITIVLGIGLLLNVHWRRRAVS